MTRFSIHHHMAVLVLCVAILLMGINSYLALPRENFPDVKVPYVIVTTPMRGANPTDIETSITIPMEKELDNIDGLKEIKSVSTEGMSQIVLEFNPDLDTEVSLSRTRDKVDIAKGELPPDADEPIVMEFSFSEVPVMIFNVAASENVSLAELKEIAEKLQDKLEEIPGVLKVDMVGDRERVVIIELDMKRLDHYSITADQAIGVLRGTNQNISAGTAEGPSRRIVVRVPGEFESPAEIFNLPVHFTQEGVPVYMRDIATVRYDFESETSRSRIYDFVGDGEIPAGHYVPPHKSISLQLKKRTGENLLAIAEQAKGIVADFPVSEDIKIIKTIDMSKDVNMMLADLENNIGTALLLVLAVMLVGLGARNAILVALAIPFSMLLSFIVLNIMGQTLNMIVLFSLILALGMLVDNAIVIIENIYRYHCMGLGRVEAAIKGTEEMSKPVIASTATTLAAFAPMIFWPGIMGEFMSYLPMTVIVVLSSSLFVALVINPTLTSMLVKRDKNADSSFDPENMRPTYPLAIRYKGMLEYMLGRPFWTLATALVLLIFSFVFFGFVNPGVEFFPSLDPAFVTLSITPPEGTSLDKSDEYSRMAEARVFGLEGSGYDNPVENLKYATVSVSVGGSVGGPMEGHMGPIQAQIAFVDRDYRSESTSMTMSKIRNRLEGLDDEGNPHTYPLYGAEFNVSKPQEGPPTGKPLSVNLYGEDLNEMSRQADAVKRIMNAIPEAVKPTDDASTAQPTLEWKIDRARAAVFGLTQGSIAQALQIAIDGLNSGTFGHGDNEQDIDLQMPQAYRNDFYKLMNVSLPMPTGISIPLSAVATAKLVAGPVSINRLDRNRVINAGAELIPGIRDDSSVRLKLEDELRHHHFPPGIKYELGGAAEEEQKAKDFLTRAFIIALFSIAMVLVLQFNSIFVMFIIMCSVLLSLMGVFTGLAAFNQPFGIIMSGIGVISLAGIVVNNAIVLLDAIRNFEDQGKATYEAIVSACMIRLRPVLLTAVTTILSIIPMAAKFNLDFRTLWFQYDTETSQWWQSMALAIIFGLVVSTILTLGVVPTLYLIYQKANNYLFHADQPVGDKEAESAS